MKNDGKTGTDTYIEDLIAKVNQIITQGEAEEFYRRNRNALANHPMLAGKYFNAANFIISNKEDVRFGLFQNPQNAMYFIIEQLETEIAQLETKIAQLETEKATPSSKKLQKRAQEQKQQ